MSITTHYTVLLHRTITFINIELSTVIVEYTSFFGSKNTTRLGIPNLSGLHSHIASEFYRQWCLRCQGKKPVTAISKETLLVSPLVSPSPNKTWRYRFFLAIVSWTSPNRLSPWHRYFIHRIHRDWTKVSYEAEGSIPNKQRNDGIFPNKYMMLLLIWVPTII